MDRSMDSIGSCSLDVDAESSDISDTSGSLNFPTPISIKDITREFTNNIRERCSVQTVKNTTAYVDPVTGQVCIALTQAPTTTVNNATSGIVDGRNHSKTNINTTTATITTSALLSPQTPEDSYDKKPSYLNLACCVNGYSNITTYDSKIRQDINKSREVSPIRPSSSSLQYCKKSNSLAPPVLLAMPNINLTSPQQQQPPHTLGETTSATVYATSSTIGSKYSLVENNSHNQNGIYVHNPTNEGGGGGKARSFIQQRVERLYGPGALAQGFYSPKKVKDSSLRLNKMAGNENSGSTNANNELARKFQELSPNKDYNQFRKKLSNGKPSVSPNNMAAKDDSVKPDNNNIDLPCLRHLSQEFRAQLPVISPKRNFSRTSPGRDLVQSQALATTITNGNSDSNNTPPSTIVTSPTSDKQFESKLQQHHKHQQETTHHQNNNTITISSSQIAGQDELDHKVVVVAAGHDGDVLVLDKLVTAIAEPKVMLPTVDSQNSMVNISSKDGGDHEQSSTTNGSAEPGPRDAHYFLKQLRDEQNRLLIMAAEAEKCLDSLTSNPDVSEDTLGLLRSASGKARLLVSQKMKQFEGLCHKNLNCSPEDQFPTTLDDLQGFWDMVYLQVDHIDSIFADMQKLKQNDWKKPIEEQPVVNVSKLSSKNSKSNISSKLKQNIPVTNGGAVPITPSPAALKREAQRKKLQEMKRRNREAMAAANANSNPNNESSAIEIVGVVNVKNEVDVSADIQQIR